MPESGGGGRGFRIATGAVVAAEGLVGLGLSFLAAGWFVELAAESASPQLVGAGLVGLAGLSMTAGAVLLGLGRSRPDRRALLGLRVAAAGSAVLAGMMIHESVTACLAGAELDGSLAAMLVVFAAVPFGLAGTAWLVLGRAIRRRIAAAAGA